MKRITGVFNRSLPARLLLIFIGVGIGMVVILLVTFSMGMSEQWRSNLRPHLVQYLDYVNADIGDPPNIERARELAERLPINIYITGPDMNFTSTGRPLDTSELEFKDRQERRKKRNWSGKVDFGEHDNRTVLRNQLGDHIVYFELARHSHSPHKHRVFLCALAILAGLLWLCFHLIRRQLKPVQTIAHGVGLMGAGDFAHRIDVPRNDDLGELATSINTMASDIEQMLDAKRQLLLGISHELRSPLTRARVSTELLEESNNRVRILDDLLEMESLITDILESERLNSRHGVLNRTSVGLIDLIQNVVIEGHYDGVTITDQTDQGTFELDEPRVRLLLRNLLGNAMRYGAQATTPPVVVVSAEHERIDQMSGVDAVRSVSILVKDSGPGIHKDDLGQLTEPFYRADPSRSRHTGGFGLGLYLCRLICEAHGGHLTIQSQPGEGTQVTAVLGDGPGKLAS